MLKTIKIEEKYNFSYYLYLILSLHLNCLFPSITVIRAKISSEKVVPASDDPLDTHKMIRYEIKQIKVHGITQLNLKFNTDNLCILLQLSSKCLKLEKDPAGFKDGRR